MIHGYLHSAVFSNTFTTRSKSFSDRAPFPNLLRLLNSKLLRASYPHPGFLLTTPPPPPRSSGWRVKSRTTPIPETHLVLISFTAPLFAHLIAYIYNTILLHRTGNVLLCISAESPSHRTRSMNVNVWQEHFGKLLQSCSDVILGHATTHTTNEQTKTRKMISNLTSFV